MNMHITNDDDLHLQTPYETLKEVSNKKPKDIAYSYFKRKVTYKKLLKQVDAVAKSFSKLNVGVGDVVSICAPNIPEVLISFYALNKLGATVNLLHHLAPEDLIEKSLNNTKSKIILVNTTSYIRFKDVLEKVNLENIIITSTRKSMDLLTKIHYNTIKIESKTIRYPKNVMRWTKFLIVGNTSRDVVQSSELDTKAVITYDYNSPNLEGIIHNNKNIQSAVEIQKNLFDLPKLPVTLGLIPFSDGHGLVSLHTTLTHGGKFVILPYFDIEDFVKIIQKDKPNVILGLPSFYESILNITLKNSDLSYFKLVICEGECLDSNQEEEINNFLTKHNAPKVTTTYSMPETLSIIAKIESNKIINNSQTQFKLLNSELDEKGYIGISAPNVMVGYLNDSERTNDVLKEEDGNLWLYTKNQGYVDDGKIVIIPPIKTKKSSYILSSQYPGQKLMGNKFYTFVKVFFGPLFSLLYSPVVLNSEKIPTTGPMILCGNHRHVLDQCAPMIETSRNVHYLAKKEYFDSSYALFFKLMGCISVNRQIKDNKATSSALEVLRNGGAVGIFPEGTRNRTEDVLLPFKFGAVSMAKKTNALIVPFAISGEFKIGSNNGLIVSIGDPFKVGDDLELANNHLRNVILDLLEKNNEYWVNKN